MAYSRANNQPTRNEQQKYYLPRIDLEKYNVIIDGRNFYDNPIESYIEKYRELEKVILGKEKIILQDLCLILIILINIIN